MDILQQLLDNNYRNSYEKTFSAKSLRCCKCDQLGRISIETALKELDNYKKKKLITQLVKSNPFGYAKWFERSRAIVFKSRNCEREKLKLFSRMEETCSYNGSKISYLAKGLFKL